MSVYKGEQLIATNGRPGADGRDGQGIMIVKNYTELHNNINADGHIEMTNKVVPADGESEAHATSCEVGGFDNKIIGTGSTTMVWGYGNIVKNGECGIVLGYENNVDDYGQGVCVNGFENTATGCHPGTHIEGYDNIINVAGQGAHIEGNRNNVTGTSEGAHIEGCNNTVTGTDKGTHIEGAMHSYVKVSADGGHQGGYGITANTPELKLPHQRPGTYQSTILEAIGLPMRGANGEYARIVRADGSMAINGDMSFVATKADGTPDTDTNHPDGVYTLGEIVRALHEANIRIPKHT